MLDSGATGNFLDISLAQRLEIKTVRKALPEPVRAVDGSELSSGSITHQTQDLVLVCDNGHTENLAFDLIDTPLFGAILGIPWLQRHNPIIDWEKRLVTLHSRFCTHSCYPESTEFTSPLICGSVSSQLKAEYNQLPEVYRGFTDVFDKVRAAALPPHRSFDCRIDLLPGAQLPCSRIYALTEQENLHLRKYLDDLLKTGFIRKSSSPVSSPLFFVPKKYGELRTCIDYRAINKVTVKNRYPLPLIPVLLDQVRRSTIFSKLDLRGAYHLVRVKAGDEWKTAFRTKFGLFEYLVMPFGLCNAPAAFQFFINEVLQEFLDICAVVYIDDILIFSANLEEHIGHVKAVLGKLREHHLFAKLEKCIFHTTTVEFLGFFITPEGIKMDQKKVEAILNWPPPSTVKEVQSFLGFANFYRRFIQGFSEVVSPITRLLKKGVRFAWSEEADRAFSSLKGRFTSAPILQHPDTSQPFLVEVDASQCAVGGILSQRDPKTGLIHPVAFFSKKLLPAEQHYTISERELLAIKKAFTEWRHYLLGARHTVTVYTDHKNLRFLKSARALTPRQMRWMLFFNEFDFLITFKPGIKNSKADALSRLADPVPPIDPIPPKNIISSEKVLAVIESEDFLKRVQVETAKLDSALWESNKDQTTKEGFFFKNKRLFIPTQELRDTVLNWCHDSPLSVHPGRLKTKQMCLRNFWWEGLDHDSKVYVDTCPICTRNKDSRSRPTGLLQTMPTPPVPWHTLSLDFITGLPISQGKSCVLVVIDYLSKMGHFIALKALPTAKEMAQIFLDHIVRLHGLPTALVSDRGPQFTAKFWRNLCKLLDVDVRLSSAYHPQTDGQTERLNQTLEQSLRCLLASLTSEWATCLSLTEFAYNNKEHAATGVSPFFCLLGVHPRSLPINVPTTDLNPVPAALDQATKMILIHQKAKESLDAYKSKTKTQTDKHRKLEPNYQVGQMVWLSTKNLTQNVSRKFQPRFIGPFQVDKILNPVSVKLKLPEELKIHPTFHVSLLKPFHPDTRPEPPPPHY